MIHRHHLRTCHLVDQTEDQYRVSGQDPGIVMTLILLGTTSPWRIHRHHLRALLLHEDRMTEVVEAVKADQHRASGQYQETVICPVLLDLRLIEIRKTRRITRTRRKRKGHNRTVRARTV